MDFAEKEEGKLDVVLLAGFFGGETVMKTVKLDGPSDDNQKDRLGTKLQTQHQGNIGVFQYTVLPHEAVQNACSSRTPTVPPTIDWTADEAAAYEKGPSRVGVRFISASTSSDFGMSEVLLWDLQKQKVLYVSVM